MHASIALVEAAKKHSGKLCLVAIGPLTNIAVALKLEPDLPELLHSFTIMGGCDGGGNVTPTAEFNFHCDPEAAQAVSNTRSFSLASQFSAFVQLSHTAD